MNVRNYTEASGALFYVGLPHEEHERKEFVGKLTDDECCAANHDGYYCTLRKGHSGRHVAHGHAGQVWAVWEDADVH